MGKCRRRLRRRERLSAVDVGSPNLTGSGRDAARGRLGRWPRRWLRHHLPLALLTCGFTAALYFTRPYRDVISRASFSTAYPALGLLAATLLIGPLNVLRRRANPVSSDLRRDVGIWAGVVSIVHAAVGQFMHLRGRPWLYYVYGPSDHHHSFPLRCDLFGLANYTGAIGVLVVAALVTTSNDFWLQKLGTAQWKQLQRWNYAVFALAAIHSFAFQAIERQKLSFVSVVAGFIAVAVAMQLAGFQRTRAAQLGHECGEKLRSGREPSSQD